MNEKDTLYARWLSGELSVSELEQLKKSGELKELEAIVVATDQLELPDFDVEKAYENFNTTHSSIAKVRKLSVRKIVWISGIAASFLLLIVAVLFLNNRPQSYQAANNSTTSFQLLDGSQVVLNDGSSLEFDKRTWEEERLVKLEGEAYFEVKKGSRFTVESSKGIVSVLGTSFNMNAWGTQLLVECYEGRVQVESNGDQKVIIAQQGVRLNDGVLVLDSIQHENPLWQSEISQFYATPAHEVFEELARQFDVIVNVPLLKTPFSGNFEHNQLEKALNDVCKPLNLNFRISNNGKEVYISDE